MKRNCLISVVIPVGPGHEKLYINAVDSLVAQTFQKWELILVNDSGNKLPWIPAFAKYIETSGAQGVAHARNLGIAASSAPLFIPLDADDILEPTAISDLLNEWKRSGGYVYCDWREITGKIHETDEYNCKAILDHMTHAVTALYPKEAWTKVSGYDETLMGW